MDLYAGLGIETAPLSSFKTKSIEKEKPKKEEDKKPWSSNFQLMASQLQRKKVTQGRGKTNLRARGGGYNSNAIVQVSMVYI